MASVAVAASGETHSVLNSIVHQGVLFLVAGHDQPPASFSTHGPLSFVRSLAKSVGPCETILFGSSNWVPRPSFLFQKWLYFLSSLFPLAPKHKQPSQSDCSPPELQAPPCTSTQCTRHQSHWLNYAPKQDGTWPSHAHISAGNTARDSGNVCGRAPVGCLLVLAVGLCANRGTLYSLSCHGMTYSGR